jgi:hypothetical protein
VGCVLVKKKHFDTGIHYQVLGKQLILQMLKNYYGGINTQQTADPPGNKFTFFLLHMPHLCSIFHVDEETIPKFAF